MTLEEQIQAVDNQLLRCREWIEAALEYTGGTHDFIDIRNAVQNGSMQLWASEDSCAVTEIIVYPKKKVLHVFLAGGTIDGIIDMQKSAAEWGKMYGCSEMTIAGRQGWSKVLKSHGWRTAFTVMEKEI